MNLKNLFTSSSFPLIIAIACGHFAVDCMVSIFPAYKTMASIDLAVAGVVAGSCVFFAEATQLFFGKWIDKGYHKILLIAGILGTFAASLFPYAPTLPIVFSLLLLTNIGSASFHPAAASILGHLPGQSKSIAMGIFATFGMAGMSVGQLLFTWVAETANGHTALLGILCVCIAIALYCMKIAQAKPQVAEHTISLSLFLTFFKSKALRSLYFIQLANQTLIWATVFILPDLLKARGCNEWVVFGGGHFCFILGAAVSSIPAGFVAANLGTQKTISYAFFITLLFLAQIIFFKEMPAPLLLTNLFCYGACLGAIPPLVLSLGNELVPHNRGMVSAFLMGLVWIISETLGLGGTGIIASLFENDGAEHSLLLLAIVGILLGGRYAYHLAYLSDEELVYKKDA